MFYRKLKVGRRKPAVESASARPAGMSERVLAWREFCSPSALGCLGLALAIVLWGYGYRLSVYQSHRDAASRTLAAKLWVDQRHSACTVGVQQQHPPSEAPEPSPLHSFHLVCVCALVVGPMRVRFARSSKSLLPLRSPPFTSFSA